MDDDADGGVDGGGNGVDNDGVCCVVGLVVSAVEEQPMSDRSKTHNASRRDSWLIDLFSLVCRL